MYTRQLPVGSAYAPSSLPAGGVSAPRTVHAPVYVYQPIAPTNTSAIVALVLTLISFTTSFFLLGIVGIVFGHVARAQIKTRGERGDGMALAALWIGYLSTIFWILFWLVYFGFIALVVGLSVAAEGSVS